MKKILYFVLFLLSGCGNQSKDAVEIAETDPYEPGACVVQYYTGGEFYCINDDTAHNCSLIVRYGPSFLEFHSNKQCSALGDLGPNSSD